MTSSFIRADRSALRPRIAATINRWDDRLTIGDLHLGGLAFGLLCLALIGATAGVWAVRAGWSLALPAGCWLASVTIGPPAIAKLRKAPRIDPLQEAIRHLAREDVAVIQESEEPRRPS